MLKSTIKYVVASHLLTLGFLGIMSSLIFSERFGVFGEATDFMLPSYLLFLKNPALFFIGLILIIAGWAVGKISTD